MNTIKNAFKKGIFQGIGLAVAFVGSTALLAATVAGTVNTFATGDLLDATKINENFASLKTAVEAINPQYSTSEVATDQVWINGKTIYRKVIDFGALPNATSKSAGHGLTGTYKIVRLRGISNDGTQYLPLPYNTQLQTQEIGLTLNGVSIFVTSGADYSLYTDTQIVIEYTKN